MTTVKNPNPKGLRKCTLSYMKDDVFYFHKWAEQGQVQRHPEDPQKDTTFASTYGIVECVKTGKIRCPEPNNITFLL
jgi:hypothetical protein